MLAFEKSVVRHRRRPSVPPYTIAVAFCTLIFFCSLTNFKEMSARPLLMKFLFAIPTSHRKMWTGLKRKKWPFTEQNRHVEVKSLSPLFLLVCYHFHTLFHVFFQFEVTSVSFHLLTVCCWSIRRTLFIRYVLLSAADFKERLLFRFEFCSGI